jgi:hypothetical protein
MKAVHNLGFPRIGAKRYLKFALGNFGKAKQSKTKREAL